MFLNQDVAVSSAIVVCNERVSGTDELPLRNVYNLRGSVPPRRAPHLNLLLRAGRRALGTGARFGVCRSRSALPRPLQLQSLRHRYACHTALRSLQTALRVPACKACRYSARGDQCAQYSRGRGWPLGKCKSQNNACHTNCSAPLRLPGSLSQTLRRKRSSGGGAKRRGCALRSLPSSTAV